LTADFDGDTSSGNIAYSDEAIAEAEKFFNTKKAYIGTDGKLLYSCAVETVELVLHSLTGEPVMAPAPAVESFSLIDSLNAQMEPEHDEDTFVYLGVWHSLKDILDIIHYKKPEMVSMQELEWDVAKSPTVDAPLLAELGANYPLIAIRDYCKVHVLVGKERLRRLHSQGATEAPVLFIDQDMLDIARVEK
jgi:hypothetical protein